VLSAGDLKATDYCLFERFSAEKGTKSHHVKTPVSEGTLAM